MSWKQKITNELADKLRFTVRGVLFVNAIMLSLASIYLVGKLIWFTLRFLERTIFASPW